MEITYIIQAHKEPLQLLRLINTLSSENVFFYIHIDKKADLTSFTKIIFGENILFIEERTDCIWGDFSQVVATLSLVKKVIMEKRDGMVILISGQDYPIRSTQYIRNFLLIHPDVNFISGSPINQIWPKKECRTRTEFYRFNYSSLKGHYKTLRRPGIKALKSLLRRRISFQQFFLLFKKRELKPPIEFYGGSQWWAFNSKTLISIYEFIEENQKSLFSYFQYMHCADEIFFHSIINHLKEKDSSINIKETITFVNWISEKIVSPIMFTKDDFHNLVSQPETKLFARKFDISHDSEILNLLDKNNQQYNR